MMKIPGRSLFAVLSLCVTLIPIFAEESPAPGEVAIEDLQYGGSGCPQGSVGKLLSPDAKAFTLLFDQFIAEGKNQGVTKKTCQLRARFRVPAGWSMGILAVDYRGFAQLEAGSQAQQITRATLRGTHERQVGRMDLQGPVNQDYFNRTNAVLDNDAYTPCDGRSRNVAIFSQIEVRGKGLMTVDSVNGELKNQFALKWKRCEPVVACKGFLMPEGTCWYPGGRPGESCNDACKNRGGALPAPLSDEACRAMVARFYPILAQAAQGRFLSGQNSGLGCGVTLGRQGLTLINGVNLPGAADARTTRACACAR